MNAMFTQAKTHTLIRSFTNHRSAILFPLLACALLVGLVSGPVKTAQAQTDVRPTAPKLDVENPPAPGVNRFGITSAPWRAHFGGHAADVLRTADPESKKEAMRDLIAVAARSDGNIDLSDTLSPLVRIFEEGISEDHSLMALQTLDLIGTEHSSESRYRQAMREIYQAAQKKSSDQVRGVAAALLQDFFGEDES